MIRKIGLVIIFATLTNLKARGQETITVLGNGCAYSGVSKQKDVITFDADDAAQAIFSKLLKQVGLPSDTFKLYAATVDNAAADIDKNNVRYIFYNQSFIGGISKKNRDWAATAILAHEIGHHLLNHTFSRNAKRKVSEIAADRYSGFILGQIGATLIQAQSGVKSLGPESVLADYPSKKERMDAVYAGWQMAEDARKSAKLIDVDTPNEKPVIQPKAIIPKKPVPNDADDIPAVPSEFDRKINEPRFQAGSNRKNATAPDGFTPQPAPPSNPFFYVSRCVFPAEQTTAFLVTNTDDIVAVLPNNQISLVGKRLASANPNFAWICQRGAASYGVTYAGQIIGTNMYGQQVQIGYVTNP